MVKRGLLNIVNAIFDNKQKQMNFLIVYSLQPKNLRPMGR